MATTRITLYNLSDLKNTSDDAIPNYLNSLKFTQSFRLQDVRLVLGYSAFALSALCFLWDYKLGWDTTKHWTAGAVAVYMVLNAALTFWIARVEKNVVYQGTAPSGDEITISTSTKKNVPIYKLSVTVQPKKQRDRKNTPLETYTIAQEFAGWFDELGFFVAAPFQQMLASAVPCIGKQDPKRVKPAAASLVDADPNLLDAVLAANSSATDKQKQRTTVKQRKI